MKLLSIVLFFSIIGCSAPGQNEKNVFKSTPIISSGEISLDGQERDGSFPDRTLKLLEAIQDDLLLRINYAQKLGLLSDSILQQMIENIPSSRKGYVTKESVNLEFLTDMISNIRTEELYQENKNSDKSIRIFFYGMDSTTYIKATKNFYNQYESYTQRTTPVDVRIEIQRKILHEISHLWGFKEKESKQFSKTLNVKLKKWLQIDKEVSLKDFKFQLSENEYDIDKTNQIRSQVSIWENVFTTNSKALGRYVDELINDYKFVNINKKAMMKYKIFNGENKSCIEIEPNHYHPKKLIIKRKLNLKMSQYGTDSYPVYTVMEKGNTNPYHISNRYELYDVGFMNSYMSQSILVFDDVGDIFIEKYNKNKSEFGHKGIYKDQMTSRKIKSYIYCSSFVSSKNELERRLYKRIILPFKVTPNLKLLPIETKQNFFEHPSSRFVSEYTSALLNVKSAFGSYLNSMLRGKAYTSFKNINENGLIDKCNYSIRTKKTKECISVILDITLSITNDNMFYNGLVTGSLKNAMNRLNKIINKSNYKKIKFINDSIQKLKDFYNNLPTSEHLSKYESEIVNKCDKHWIMKKRANCLFKEYDYYFNNELPVWLDRGNYMIKFENLMNELLIIPENVL
jgi:hypothetical protein